MREPSIILTMISIATFVIHLAAVSQFFVEIIKVLLRFLRQSIIFQEP